MIFKDRHEAGQQLARELSKYKNKKDVIVLGIPRGGVEVAFNIAKTLKVPLSIVVTKKIGHPFESEFAIGAVSPGGHYSINKQYQAEAGEGYIKNTIKELTKEINRRYKEYTNEKLPKLKNKIVILVDDGLATGFTMLSAVEYVQSQNPKKIIVAIPVAAQDSFEKVKAAANEVVCLQIPVFFAAVGGFYQNFMQLEDEEVKYYLKEGKKYC
ncbi:MAG: phosphoribosyltransferase family protein [Candidatus Woesearchaeota archaeon]|jgi:predicted phosphoribosyltransferase|nr:phosphoribosyltransferase [Candidatus Woesearchaeota archaeon]MDP6599818.1 phosphoribosyltransferase family protein [Candidatus Woesearchaeota archaeon]|tara:strand:+ start:1223 stop:1858 length:636 start_codon:yes stop_codon:yes gene_type:complete